MGRRPAERTNAIALKRGGVFLCLLFALASGAHADCISVHPRVQAIADKDDMRLPEVPKMSPQAAKKKFDAAYVPLDATVRTEGKSFSASKMLEKLWRLYGLARASGECSPELSRLLTTISIIEFKRGYPGEATTFAEAALSINPLDTPAAVSEAIDLHFLVAESTRDPASGLRHIQAALEVAPRDPKLDAVEHFGLRQRLGYWLHESGRFAEARENNTKLLADLEKHFGKEDANLLGVLENLAQNHYSLHEFDTSAAYLNRCMALAAKHGRTEVESRMLFQLGVLAYERGNLEEARRYMQARIEHAERHPEADLLRLAKSGRDELEQRISDDAHKPGAAK